MVEITWRRLDIEGIETCRLDGQTLSGLATFGEWRLEYVIECDGQWRTRTARVNDIHIEASNGKWSMNGEEQPQVSGCIDIDLNFSPSTNLLPIRRLALQVGQEASVRAAWLRFPSFKLELLEQTYRRVNEDVYRYESASGTFVRDLKVNAAGFVVDYPGLWIQSDAPARGRSPSRL